MIHIRAIGDVSESETEYGKFEMATSDRDDFCSMYLLIASRSRVDIPFFICPFQGFMWSSSCDGKRIFVNTVNFPLWCSRVFLLREGV